MFCQLYYVNVMLNVILYNISIEVVKGLDKESIIIFNIIFEKVMFL